MKYFKIIVLFFCTICLLSGFTGEFNIVNKSGYTPMGVNDDTLIEHKAGYNFILTNFNFFTDCKELVNPCTSTIDLLLSNTNNSGSTLLFQFNNYSADETRELLFNGNKLLFDGLIELDNTYGDYGIYYNFSGYYELKDSSILHYINSILLSKNNEFNSFVSLLLLYIIHIYLFYFFAKSGFRLGKEYFFKKRKNEND